MYALVAANYSIISLHKLQPMTITIEELQFQGRVESYIIWAVPALVKLRWYYVEYTYEGNCNPQQRHYEILMRSGGSHYVFI